MCRILMSDKRGLEKLGKEYMKGFLDVLEKSCGGHGNGYLFITEKQIIGCDKGMKLSNQEIVDRLYGELPDWFIYHTRVASKGSIKDSNCHPYVAPDLSEALCMNGTMSDFGAISKHFDITDTEMLFNMKVASGLTADKLVGLSPRFMGIENGKVYAVNNGYAQSLEYDDNECIIIASEFPKDYKDNKTMKNDWCWYEGMKLEEEPKKVTYLNSSVKNYSGSYYGGYKNYHWNVNDYDSYIYGGNTVVDEPLFVIDNLTDLKEIAKDAKGMLEVGLSKKYIEKSLMYDYDIDDIKNIKITEKGVTKKYSIKIEKDSILIQNAGKTVYSC